MQNVVLIHESITYSIVTDFFGFLGIAALLGAGKLLKSVALEWIGSIMFCILIVQIANYDGHRKSPQEAADWLRDKFGVVAAAPVVRKAGE